MTAQPSHPRRHVPQVTPEQDKMWRVAVVAAANRKIQDDLSQSRFATPPPVPTVNADQHGGDCSGGDDES